MAQVSFLKGKRILAVDDEEDVLETIKDVLEEALEITSERELRGSRDGLLVQSRGILAVHRAS